MIAKKTSRYPTFPTLVGAACVIGAIALLASSAAPFGCQQKRDEDCEKPRPDDKRCRIERPSADATGGRPVAPAERPTPAPPLPAVAAGAAGADVPGLALGALSAGERALFWSVVEDQFDPCGKPRSFGETLRTGDRAACPLAWSVALWAVSRVKAGDERPAIVYGLLERLRREHDRATFRLDGRPRSGPADAAVTVVEFYDYACTYCREVEPEAEKLRGRFPNVAYVLKQCPLEQHEGADAASRALLAATKQGRVWELHRRLLAAPTLDEAAITAAAGVVGLDAIRLRADMAATDVERLLREDLADADAARVQGTPSFFVNGVEVPFDELDERIREALDAPPVSK